MEKSAPAIYRPEFWEEQWNSLNDSGTAFTGYGSKNVWDAMAGDYGRHHDATSHDERLDATLDRLEKGGIEFENASVLDVGCGPGRFAAAFAARGARVVAVDISEKMIERLRAETDPALLERITPVVADWKTLDPDTCGYDKSFDLAFANMTPAVINPGSFKRFMAASKRWCWFRGWAGPRENPLLERVYRAVFGADPQPFMGNFICAWNLVCASGYFPECGFETIGWRHKKPIEESVKFHAALFSQGDAAKEKVFAEKIAASLSDVALDGFVENSFTGHTGSMMWSVAG